MEALFAAYALVLIQTPTWGPVRIQTIMRFDSERNCEFAARQMGFLARGETLVCLPGVLR